MTNQSGIPSIIIVLLNWNGKEDTLECLASLGKINYLNYRIIVVDNGSTDGSVDVISAQYPDIVLLETGENLGYAGGNNVGIRWALNNDAEYVLILNNDTVVDPELLNVFMKATRSLPEHSILGAKIYYYDKPDTIWFAGGRWRNYAEGFEHIGQNKIDSEEFNHPITVDYITGCALFANAQSFKQIGLLDEDFFLTYEETDWCYRARAEGYKCIVVPEAKLWHKVSASFGGETSPIISYFYSRNKTLWAKKNLGMNSVSLLMQNIFMVFRLCIPTFVLIKDGEGSLTRNLLSSLLAWMKSINWNFYNRKYHIIATLIGLRDFYLGRFGNCPEQVRVLHRPKRKT